MTLRRLLLFHAIITLAAGVVLIVAPALIPGTVDIALQKDQFLLCYFLAAAELAVAYLSYCSSNITDPLMLRHVVVTVIILHGATMVLELFALARGISPKLIANVVARVVIIGLFYYYGIIKLSYNKRPEGSNR